MATSRRQTISTTRDIFADNSMPSRGFMGLLGLVLFQPRQFFRLLNGTATKHGFLVALLILTLIGYSAIQQASLANAPAVLPDEGIPLDGEIPTVVPSDPTEAWMTGLTAAGTQVIYWLVLAIVLSEVSLLKGKAPQLGHNLRIVIWASVPFALMAVVQILYIMGGGTIQAAGFTGLLDEWAKYATLDVYLQSAVYAFASQLNLFWLWNLALVYIGARESLKGKRPAIIIAIAMWILLLVAAFGFEHYQTTHATFSGEIPYEEEFLPEDAMATEGDIPLDDEMLLPDVQSSDMEDEG